MRVVIQDNYEKMCKWAADYIAAKINAHKEDRPFVLGLPTGSSPRNRFVFSSIEIASFQKNSVQPSAGFTPMATR